MKPKTERDIEILIGKLLRYGVLLSCLVTGLGGLLFLFQNYGSIPNYSPHPEGFDTFTGTPEYLHHFSGIISGIKSLDGAAVIQLGVILLVATPILRVFFSFFAFLYEKDYLYVSITLIVLLIIVANMLFGLH